MQQPRRANDGGIGYSDLPRRSSALGTDVLDFSGVKILVVDHWVGEGELEIIEQALRAVPCQLLRGLSRVELTNAPLQNQAANAVYNIQEKSILLCRSASRNWSRWATNDLNRTLASKTIWHELGHHIWFNDRIIETPWFLAMKGDGLAPEKLSYLERVELFAEQFSDYTASEEDFCDRPNLAALFGRIRAD